MIIEMKVYGTREAPIKAWQEDTKQEQNWLTCCTDWLIRLRQHSALYKGCYGWTCTLITVFHLALSSFLI